MIIIIIKIMHNLKLSVIVNKKPDNHQQFSLGEWNFFIHRRYDKTSWTHFGNKEEDLMPILSEVFIIVIVYEHPPGIVMWIYC